jgi:hypothetical protein
MLRLHRNSRHAKRSGLIEALETRTLLSTYYVATTGSDSSGTGSQTAPFATIQWIVGSLQPGDTLDVEPGTYAGFILGWDSTGTYGTISGTASQPITIQADPNASGSVIINSRNDKTPVGIDLEPDDNYVTISGFTVDDSSGGITGTPSDPILGDGIKVTGNNDSVINCTVSNINYGFGIIADNANNVLIQDNNINHTHSQGNGDYGHGVYLSGTLTGAEVIGNQIYDNDYIGIHVNGDASEGGVGLVTNALIEDNQIYDNGQNGINTDGMQNSVVENNLIYGYQDYGIAMYQSNASGGSINNLIVNNTIVDTAGADGSAIRILDGSTGNTIFNNILLGGSQGTIRISNDSLSGLQSNYNIVDDLYQSEDTGNTESLAQWQQQTGQDLNSIIVPFNLSSLFVNPSVNNYQLAASGPAVDAGVDSFNGFSAPTVDLLGNPRPSGANWDIGAYELQQQKVVAPTVSSFRVNDGSVQRSMVDSVSVVFNEPVSVAANAITLNLLAKTGGASTPMNFSLNSPNGGTTWVLAFTNSSYIGGSLPDGSYLLDIGASGVTSSQGLQMTGSNPSFSFWRMFGDFTGIGLVNGADFGIMANAFGSHATSSDWYLDYNGDGVINGIDFAQFAGRFGKSMSNNNVLAIAASTTTMHPIGRMHKKT